MCKSDYCEWVAGIGGLQKCHKFGCSGDTFYSGWFIIGCPIEVWAKCQKFTRRKSCFGGYELLAIKLSRADTFFGKGRLRETTLSTWTRIVI